jgi:large subunit ribosomal protein L18e
MKSKTKISKQIRNKRNPELVETVLEARKNSGWFRISEILSSPRRNRVEKNLSIINNEAKEGESIVVPGKVLSVGEIDKKVRVIALNFSSNAQDKILKAGGKISTIIDEIKKNPEAKGIKILE